MDEDQATNHSVLIAVITGVIGLLLGLCGGGAIAGVAGYALVLQRRTNPSQASASGVGAFGLLIAALGLTQPGQQFVRGPVALRQQPAQHSRDLRTGDLGHIFPPSPVGGPTGRFRPTGPW